MEKDTMRPSRAAGWLILISRDAREQHRIRTGLYICLGLAATLALAPVIDSPQTGSWSSVVHAAQEVSPQVSSAAGVAASRSGAEMVLIAPGRFKMGSPRFEQGRQEDEMLHDVTIP